jgi:hypothetical protein
MSKFLKVMMVVALVAAMVAPAVAEDRLSLAGSMRVRGWFVNSDDGTTDESFAWNDQRLRVGGKIAIAEGVSVNFRFDASESEENSSDGVAWGGANSGSNGNTFAPYSNRRADVQFDKAYLQIAKGGYTVMAGQMYFGGFASGHLLDTAGAGIIIKRGNVMLAHVKETDEINGEAGGMTGLKDSSITAAKIDIKNDTMAITPMISYLAAGDDEDLLGLGVAAAAKLGAVNIKGEINYFDGQQAGTNGADRKGLQGYVDASSALSDTFTLGGILAYAQGQDGANEEHASYMDMPVFAEWHPETYGFYSGDVDQSQTYDPTGQGAGVIAAIVYADLKLSDALDAKLGGTFCRPKRTTLKTLTASSSTPALPTL